MTVPNAGEPFVFEQTWAVPFPPGEVYAVLADPAGYPRWWPQVRSAVAIDADSGQARVRSLLPYTLDLVLTRQVEDPVTRTLRVAIGRDLQGWSQWRLRPDGAGGTIGRYDQEVVLAVPGLARLSPVTGPVLRANHTWMMRSGERGLTRWLAREPHRR